MDRSHNVLSRARRIWGQMFSSRNCIVGRQLKRRTASHPRLALDAMEARLTPAQFDVTNTMDTGAGSLRQAIEDSNLNAGDDTIAFTGGVWDGVTPRTIMLQSALPTIAQGLTINGPGSGLLTVARDSSSGAQFRILTITDGATGTMINVSVTGLTLTGGLSGSNAGAAINFANEVLTLNDVLIFGNAASTNGGGVSGNGSLTLQNSAVMNNSATSSGGGVHMTGGSLLIENTTVANNMASSNGGGLFFSGTIGGGGFQIRNSTFSGNSAGTSGGGIQVTSSSSTITIRNSTIVGNSANSTTTTGTGPGGGGISLTSTTGLLTLQSSIVAGNTSMNPRLDISASTTTATVTETNSIVQNSFGFTLTAGSMGNQNDIDPSVGPLALNGGPTQTHALLSGSLAIDMGANPGALATDQRGFGRSVNPATGAPGTTDVGAVERLNNTPAALAAIGAITAGSGSHTFTVTYSDETNILRSSIGTTGDVIVSGPGYLGAQAATAINIDSAVDAPTITVTYSVPAPGGTWNGDDNGMYFVRLLNGAITNTAATPIGGGFMGAFQVQLARNFVVTNTNDAGPGSLRQAILAANFLTGTSDTISFNNVDGPGLTNFFDGTPDTIGFLTTLGTTTAFTESVTITGPNSSLLTVQRDAGAALAFRVFAIDITAAATITMSGMTITGGTGSSSGAGMSVDDETLNLTDIAITGNTSSTDGGGLNIGGPANVTILNSVISNNTTTGSLADGGGINTSNTSGNFPTILIRNSKIENNVSGSNGGGIYIFQGANLTIENSTVAGNSAANTTFGGGGIGWQNVAPVELTIRNSTFSDNQASGGDGGAIMISASNGNVVIENSTFSGNTAQDRGGAIFFSSTNGTIVVRNTTITNNTSNTTGSLAGDGGGGLWTGTSAFVTITSSIISGNTHTGLADRDDVVILSSATVTFSAIGNPTGLVFGSGSGNNLPFGANLDLQPLAVSPGSPTATHALGANSTAVDRGDSSGLATDQRGVGTDTVNFPRVRGLAADIGSFESTLTGRPFTVSGPYANVTAADNGKTEYLIDVTFVDDMAVDVGPTSLAANDVIRVKATLPTGVVVDTFATFVQVDSPSNGTPRVATYKLAPPGGSWDPADSGNYQISLDDNQVFDTSANSAVGGPLGSFNVVIPQTFVVTNNNDTTDTMDPGYVGSLRWAVGLANAVFGTADSITFSPSFFNVPRTITMVGEIAVTDGVTINGPAALLTVDGNFADRIFNVKSVDPITVDGVQVGEFTLTDMKLINGKRTGTLSDNTGGAIRVQGEPTTLRRVVFMNNSSTVDGGAVAFNTATTILIEDCEFLSNFTDDDTLDDGGAFYSLGQSTVTIRNSIFENNSSGGGGAIHSFGGTFLIENSTFSGNSASGETNSYGGAITFQGTLNGIIRNTTISGNSVDATSSSTSTAAGGGGIWWNGAGSLLIQHSTIYNNSFTKPYTGTASITLGAGHIGGGISSLNAGAVLTLENTIVASNFSNITGNNTLPRPDIAANTTTNPVIANFSFIGVADSGATISGSEGLAGTLGSPADPGLRSLDNYGGKFKTHAPLPNSAVIDIGFNFGMQMFDQRGLARVVDGTTPNALNSDGTDIGAVEWQPVRATVQVNDGNVQRSMVTSLIVTFNQPVTFPSGESNAIIVNRTGPGGPTGQVTLAFNTVGNVVTVTFNDPTFAPTTGSAKSLIDGKYTITLAADQIMGLDGTLDGNGNGVSQGSTTDDQVVNTHRLFGDGNGDGTVNAVDFNAFRLVYGISAGNTGFDYNGDGLVTAADFNEFRLRYGSTILP